MKPKKIIARYMTLLELLIGMALTSVLLVVLTQFYGQVSSMNMVSEQKQKESFKKRYVEHRLSTVIPAILEKVRKKTYFYTSNDLSGMLADNNPSLVFIYKAGISQDSSRSGNNLGRLYLDKQKRLSLATWSDPKQWEKDGSIPKAHTEVLMENVERLQFLFYAAPKRDRHIWRNGVFEEKPESEKKEEQKKEDEGKNSEPKVAEKKDNEKTKNNEKIKNGDEKKSENDQQANKEEENSGPERRDEWLSEWLREYKELPAMIKVIVTPVGAVSKEEDIIFAFPLPNSHEAIVYE